MLEQVMKNCLELFSVPSPPSIPYSFALIVDVVFPSMRWHTFGCQFYYYPSAGYRFLMAVWVKGRCIGQGRLRRSKWRTPNIRLIPLWWHFATAASFLFLFSHSHSISIWQAAGYVRLQSFYRKKERKKNISINSYGRSRDWQLIV